MGKIIIISLFILSGCSHASVNECAIFKPIRPEKADITAASDSLKRQLVDHNLKGQAICQWRP